MLRIFIEMVLYHQLPICHFSDSLIICLKLLYYSCSSLIACSWPSMSRKCRNGQETSNKNNGKIKQIFSFGFKPSDALHVPKKFSVRMHSTPSYAPFRTRTKCQVEHPLFLPEMLHFAFLYPNFGVKDLYRQILTNEHACVGSFSKKSRCLSLCIDDWRRLERA